VLLNTQKVTNLVIKTNLMFANGTTSASTDQTHQEKFNDTEASCTHKILDARNDSLTGTLTTCRDVPREQKTILTGSKGAGPISECR